MRFEEARKSIYSKREVVNIEKRMEIENLYIPDDKTILNEITRYCSRENV